MRMPSCKQHVRQMFFVETTQMSSSTSWCFRNSEWLRQDLIPRISPQRDWCNVFPRYFCNSNSNHFLAVLAAWENFSAVYDIIQTSLFYYFCDLYNYFWGRKNQSALKLVLDFESPSKFWGFRITYRLPVGLPLLRKRPIKNIVQIDYPRVSPGAHPLAKKPEDSGDEIAARAITCNLYSKVKLWKWLGLLNLSGSSAFL